VIGALGARHHGFLGGTTRSRELKSWAPGFASIPRTYHPNGMDPRAIGVEPDGDVVVGGARYGEATLERISPFGVIDPTLDPGNSFGSPLGLGDGEVSALASTARGLVATVVRLVGQVTEVFLVRLLPGGGLDPAVGGPGGVDTGLESTRSLAVTPDGDVVLLGGRAGRLALARLRPPLCERVPEGTACDNGDACRRDTCQAGVCSNRPACDRMLSACEARARGRRTIRVVCSAAGGAGRRDFCAAQGFVASEPGMTVTKRLRARLGRRTGRATLRLRLNARGRKRLREAGTLAVTVRLFVTTGGERSEIELPVTLAQAG
jgi:hypothetical protein